MVYEIILPWTSLQNGAKCLVCVYLSVSLDCNCWCLNFVNLWVLNTKHISRCVHGVEIEWRRLVTMAWLLIISWHIYHCFFLAIS